MPVTLFSAKDTEANDINRNLGLWGPSILAGVLHARVHVGGGFSTSIRNTLGIGVVSGEEKGWI